MKAAANGALNLSILDGWWAEGYASRLGWAIGGLETYNDPGYQDEMECEILFNTLEQAVIPLFYERNEEGIPSRWVEMIKNSLQSLCPYFNTSRMVREYAEKFYLPLGAHHARLMADERVPARALSEWKEHVRRAWPGVEITQISMEQNGVRSAGRKNAGRGGGFTRKALARRGSPRDLRGRLEGGEAVVRRGHLPHCFSRKNLGGGAYRFQGEIECRRPGMHGVSVRAVPHHPHLVHPLSLHLLTWG